MLDNKLLARNLLDTQQDSVPVQTPERNRFQYQQVQCPLQQIYLFGHPLSSIV